ncbi:MAG: deoxyribodipyrimidine photolyase [Rubripirellula sp.]|nr:deoxyribodipyrimidine photolyase [Rubripirellula sp.]
MPIPAIRHTHANDHPVREDGDYVLYWMTAFRRANHNFALQHAVDRARQFAKPLIIFEPLRLRYRWASDRLHQFVIEGMRDNQLAFDGQPVTYFPYIETEHGSGSPLLNELAARACTVVTDEYPCFFHPHMIRVVRKHLPARLELVDSNGVTPLRLPDRTFTVAHSYRRWMQKNILDSLMELPAADPLKGAKLPRLESLPEQITKRWPSADLHHFLERGGIGELPIDHAVPPSRLIVGGSAEAKSRLDKFLNRNLKAYGDDRNHPDEHVTTGLSPHLHFGHISAHEIILKLLDHENWTPDQASTANGKNHGFWNTSPPAEAFLDQVLTWREMGFNLAFRQPDNYNKFESLPGWAQKTLDEHGNDERPFIYSLQQFESAKTADPLWNAAQREIVQTGVMHNYLRMLWGKKILHWTESPRQALSIMVELNNKYGLDGRDPNSYSGIFWVLGRYDRAWGPKRPIFGSIRYMTSESARKKLRLKKYVEHFGPNRLT